MIQLNLAVTTSFFSAIFLKPAGFSSQYEQQAKHGCWHRLSEIVMYLIFLRRNMPLYFSVGHGMLSVSISFEAFSQASFAGLSLWRSSVCKPSVLVEQSGFTMLQ